MTLPSLLGEVPPSWQTWVVLAAGLIAALLALFAGRLILSRRRTNPAPAGEEPAAYDPFEQGSLTERRTVTRRKGVPVEVLVSDAEVTREPVRGWVIDRSMGGLCVVLDEDTPQGTVLSFKPRQAPPGTPWVRAEVRSCKQDRSGYAVGCQFVRTPPWAVLLLFG